MNKMDISIREKLEIGRKFSLCETIILQGFTYCLKPEYYKVLIANFPMSTSECLTVVKQLILVRTHAATPVRSTSEL